MRSLNINNNRMKPHYYRQGDVMIYGPIPRPKGLVKIKSADRVILAHGEVTGHHHSFAGGSAVLLAPDESAECTHVEITEAMALLEHQEHDTLAIPKGTYRVIRQREYTPAAIRRVAD